MKKLVGCSLLGLFIYGIIFSYASYIYIDDPTAMDWKDREKYNSRFIANIDLKTPFYLNDILDSLGTPDLTFAITKNETEYQIVYYRTQRITEDGITTKDECTGLLFKNGSLTIAGKEADNRYNQLLSIHS